MNCKYCGARLSDNASICPNCGKMVDENEGYILLSSDQMQYEDVYTSDNKKKKKGSGVKWFFSILLTLAIVAGGAYYYFNYIYEPEPEAPAITFNGGSGVINGNEKVIYVTFDDSDNAANVEYIHGVKLYPYDKTVEGATGKSVTSDYEYTKNIDSSFRAIFFDTEDLKLSDENTYTFEIMLSFYGDEKVYTYDATVDFGKKIKGNVADTVFDHSMKEE